MLGFTQYWFERCWQIPLFAIQDSKYGGVKKSPYVNKGDIKNIEKQQNNESQRPNTMQTSNTDNIFNGLYAITENVLGW